VVHGPLRGQAQGAAEHHQPPAAAGPVQGPSHKQKIELPKRGKIGKYKSQPYPFKMVGERF
jgi:hypothetical protein